MGYEAVEEEDVGRKGKPGKAGKKGGKKAGGAPRTSRASVTGVATVARNGDVVVRNKENGKLIKADFRMGPVDLSVTRKYGKGKDAETRAARAQSPELEGKIAIKIYKTGKARVAEFKLKRPAIVQVDGTLSKAEKRTSKNNFMENSLGKFAPVAAQKLKFASRDVLQAAEPKATAEE